MNKNKQLFLKKEFKKLISESKFSYSEISFRSGISLREIYKLLSTDDYINIKLDTFIKLCRGVSDDKSSNQILTEIIERMREEGVII